MTAFVINKFGGMIPYADPRSLPDNMSEVAVNCDLPGALSGLPEPEQIKDFTLWPGEVRKAYRLPGPTPGVDADAWLPLSSEHAQVVRSPLANDTLHRIYWTIPGEGAFWSTYARIAAGNAGANAPYNLGFIPPSPSSMLTVSATGGTIQQSSPNGATLATMGVAYIPGTVLTLQGGTISSGTSTTLSIVQTQAASITPNAGGSGGTDGVVRMWGTTGSGSFIIFYGTISGGALVGVDSIFSRGGYTGNPTDIAAEPVVGDAGAPTGATVTLEMGVEALAGRTSCGYSVVPTNPVATTDTGAGHGCTLNVNYLASGAVPPEISRSYLYTFVDEYGLESSPSMPSPVVDGASDGTWIVSGFPTSPPAAPAGKNFPKAVSMRLYRTLTGQTSGATFYQVTTLAFGVTYYVDTTTDLAIVNNTTLESTSWLSPPDKLDGIAVLQGGMLIGFTGNTVHFSEVNRPHAWPAGYDQSLQYPIVGMGVWQQSLVVLTQGYPATGQGGSPGNFIFTQVQVAEPCIARSSIVTDITGVFYASQNGLVSLNYSGMTNQTLSLFTKNIWLNDYAARNIVACRHRSQYLAINGTGTAFLIDYAAESAGVMRLNTFNNVIAVWNDVYSGDAYMCADKKIYRWDSPDTQPLVYRWRSRQFYFPAPQSLGACQISSGLDIENTPPPAGAPPLNALDPLLELPADANAVFNLYAGPEGANLIYTKKLHKAREVFRLPSGRKIFNWQCEVISRVEIHSIELASTMKELTGV